MPAPELIRQMRSLRQTRAFTGETIDDDTLTQILEVARWTGSSRNDQPWKLVVVDDRAVLAELAKIRPLNAWLENAAFALAVVIDHAKPAAGPWDEGRLSERVMLAADALGLGSGTAWFTTPEEISGAKAILGIPEEDHFRQMVVVGKPDASGGGHGTGGRKPLSEIVSYNRLGQHERA